MRMGAGAYFGGLCWYVKQRNGLGKRPLQDHSDHSLGPSHMSRQPRTPELKGQGSVSGGGLEGGCVG